MGRSVRAIECAADTSTVRPSPTSEAVKSPPHGIDLADAAQSGTRVVRAVGLVVYNYAGANTVPDWQGYAGGGSRVGPSRAPVTLIIFSDYQCPICRRLFLNVELISRTFPDDVAVVWRHLPLENHPFALAAARASVCAGEERRFEAMHSQLFLMQDSLGVVSWTSLALRAGIVDTAAFSSCLLRADTQARIDNDRAAARAVHAVATPTLLVNGLEYVGVPRDLARIVRYVRRRAARGI